MIFIYKVISLLAVVDISSFMIKFIFKIANYANDATQCAIINDNNLVPHI